MVKSRKAGCRLNGWSQESDNQGATVWTAAIDTIDPVGLELRRVSFL